MVAANPLLTMVSETIAAARAAERGDLVARLETVADKVRDPRRRIVVAGLGNQGKSRFVNALVNLEVCPVADDVATAVTTVLSYGEQPRATVVAAGPDGGANTREPVPFEAVPAIAGRSPRGRAVLRLELEAPSRLLADGIVVVDTPGLGAHGTTGAATVLGQAPAADAVLVLTDASTELTETEVDFLRQVRELCPAVAVLVTKTDLYPHWRQVCEANRKHLRANGLELPMLPVSAVLRAHAMRLQDEGLGRESGFGLVFQFLREQVVARDQAVLRRAVALDVSSATEHLALALGSELVALRDPERGAAAIRELHAAKAEAEKLHRHTAAWQQTLADGITDLAGDIDHDLRDIARTAEDGIDDHDPGRHWDSMDEWLTATVGSAVGDNLVWTGTRAVRLAEQVAGHFTDLGTVDLPEGRDSLDGRSRTAACTLADLEPDLGLGHKVLVGVRGSYGGVVMAGLVGTMAGMALINPLSLGAGVLLGGKAFSDDKKARLAKRRTDAKIAVRRYLDDIAFHTGKETKDRLHRIHRLLRDHFTAIADRTLRSIDESLRAAQEAANLEAARRTERAADLELRLRAVSQLRHHANTLLSPEPPPALAPGTLPQLPPPTH
ncbi:dynamin family protein [Nocardia seriolae]|nr:dynamin family protein [Nocardia seriolae]MTJ66736.1 Isoniazid-inducible protein iniA [Nocardia seriolae]MTJ73754.1 Isoniazid-inducible protein iniA [Nocardia seriolae]MTJ85428.1 Isoniazid-inducible protein iniA [Nocardia seriolae]MTK29425.1 Isoniazid-inducible protein iniA [Nocardia seriolae]MTK44667.1 Isoniazid-inducible protein iniA [Nocardia seriolae]